MTTPPKFPRVAHLAPGAGVDRGDLVLDHDGRERLLGVPVVVEEKLDGANVVVWIDEGVPRVATRGGVDAIDRGGQRGRLRSWATSRGDELRAALGDRYALYGEWLLRRHTIRYDRLPGPFVGLDVLDRWFGWFLQLHERDAVLAAVDVPSPPRRFEGTLGSQVAAEKLLGPSAFGSSSAEGVIIRSIRPGDGPRLAKLVDPAWTQRADDAWPMSREENIVVSVR
ncbi:MAG: RNA ligase family protein [Solirubrobacteraceae bacterium MAG38_C4-C5]|nr:RNA ligase family protein [Candidatus Siliceabacter maunaloa]